jgi:hypothetical protein
MGGGLTKVHFSAEFLRLFNSFSHTILRMLYVNEELQRMKQRSRPALRNYPGIFLENHEKNSFTKASITVEFLSQGLHQYLAERKKH